ncbi:hypothetical protein SCLCIDRAFT_546689 [Scleroderma citrinum Foug A]|uniref:Uncharacterized protein n=1 Tax=Scleroderma citrinum Foug A TaxID=1036808 RepID=A0A0C2YSE0_9AGAM|nr:hypothetical protein SCLCIDRAFT_546689 [Scleroderma citrinum Foug A]
MLCSCPMTDLWSEGHQPLWPSVPLSEWLDDGCNLQSDSIFSSGCFNTDVDVTGLIQRCVRATMHPGLFEGEQTTFKSLLRPPAMCPLASRYPSSSTLNQPEPDCAQVD